MAFFDSLNYTYGTTATTRRPTSVPLTFQTLPKPKIFSFTHLRSRSQQTNARLRTVLNYWRACHRPTHHAKRRASSLNLRVDTVKAYHCDQKQVSTIPLPELDLEPSPPPAQLVYPVGCAPIRIGDSEEFGWPVIPDEEDFSSSSSTSGSSMSMSPDSSATSPEVEMASSPLAHKATRPKLRCIIPPTDTPACVEIERSYFSPDSEYSATTLESSVTDEHMAAPQPMRPIQLNGALAVPVVASGRRLSWACSDISDCGIEVRPPSSSPSSSLFGSSSSSSDGDRSSSAPLTPEDAHLPTLRIKRKYDAMEDDSGDDADLSDSCDEIRGIFDKRPRFERKNWAGIIEGGQPISRPCAPVHGSRERRRSYGRA